jgi:hypothetical protein
MPEKTMTDPNNSNPRLIEKLNMGFFFNTKFSASSSRAVKHPFGSASLLYLNHDR